MSEAWDKTKDVLDPLNLFHTSSAAKDAQKAGKKAAAGLREGGEQMVDTLEGQRDENSMFFSPAQNAAQNITANRPGQSDEAYNKVSSPVPTRTSSLFSSPESTQSQDFFGSYKPAANQSQSTLTGIQQDASGVAGDISATGDRAATVHNNQDPFRQEQGVASTQGLFTNLNKQDIARTNLEGTTDVLTPLAARRAGQETEGRSGAAADRASAYEGGEMAAGLGSAALRDARVDPNQGTFFGSARADKLNAFEDRAGYAEQELAERREGTGLYDRLVEKMTRESNRAAAARGGFDSGQQIRQLSEGLEGLSLQELKQRAELAAKAQELQQGRVRDTSQALLGAEGNVVARQGINKDLALGESNLWQGVDQSRAGAVKMGIEGAQAADSTLLKNKQLTDSVTSDLGKNILSRSQQIGDLAQGSDAEKRQSIQMYNDLLAELDAQKTGREDTANAREDALLREEIDAKLRLLQTEVGAAADADVSADRTTQTGLDVAGQASDEEFRNREYDMNLAGQEDELGLGRDRLVVDAAGQASDEQARSNEAAADAYYKIGSSQAELSQRLTEAQAAGRMDAEVAAIEAEMAAAGIPLAERKEATNNLVKIGTSIIGAT